MVVRINLMHKFSFPNASILNFEKLIERKALFQFTNDCYATTQAPSIRLSNVKHVNIVN
jgi:hypothetical protein